MSPTSWRSRKTRPISKGSRTAMAADAAKPNRHANLRWDANRALSGRRFRLNLKRVRPLAQLELRAKPTPVRMNLVRERAVGAAVAAVVGVAVRRGRGKQVR